MKVYLFPADSYGCGHYRCIYPAEVLKAQGHDVIIVKAGLQSLFMHERHNHVRVPSNADVIVLQRPPHYIIAEAVHIIRSNGVAVVVDVDDDLKNIHPSNPAFTMMHPKNNPIMNWNHVARACRDATLVTVSTPALANRYGMHGRVRVLDNYIPAKYLDVPHVHNQQLLLGWAGSLHSHPDDFRQASGTLSRFAREGGRVHIVGPDIGIKEQLGTDQFSFTGNLSFEQWPYEVAKLDIGVAPLASTVFNEGKSRLKCLEYSACGVPWVASDLPEYRKLAALGAGETASKPKDWWRAVNRLATDSRLRWEQSHAGRAVAATQTYEEHAWRWAEAWADALQIERGNRGLETGKVT